MAEDYIPRSDAELLEFADNYVAQITGNEAFYGLQPLISTRLSALYDDFRQAYDEHNAMQLNVRRARET